MTRRRQRHALVRRRGRRSRARRNQPFTAADWDRVQALVRADWSPEQVAGRRRKRLGYRTPEGMLCAVTISVALQR
jgi:hypothetical protein